MGLSWRCRAIETINFMLGKQASKIDKNTYLQNLQYDRPFLSLKNSFTSCASLWHLWCTLASDVLSEPVLWSWALSFIFRHFSTIYSALSVTRSPLVPSHATRTATKPPDKSPDGSPDHSAVRYYMPSLCSPQHSTASLFTPLWIASLLPHHDETASSWWSYT